MKILFVTTLSGNKINNFMLSSILAAKKINAEYHIACNTDQVGVQAYKEECDKYGISLHHIDFDRRPFRIKNIKAYKQLKKVIKNGFFDIIHVNTPVGGILGRLAAKKEKLKVIYTAHGFHFYKGSSIANWIFYYPLEKIMLKYTDLLITINEEDYQLSKKMGAKKYKKILGVGYSAPESYDKKEIQTIIGLKEDATVMISVGELNSNKNHQAVIKEMNKIKDAYYVIIGQGKIQKELEKIAIKNGVKERVFFLGYRSDVSDLLKSADLFLFPSKREGLSLALMEAMNAGLPCIVSDIRGNRDLIQHEKGGYLVGKKDRYSSMINKALNDTTRLKQMGEFNKEISQKYKLEKIVEEYASVYLGIMEE